jgi:hypothetical protein
MFIFHWATYLINITITKFEFIYLHSIFYFENSFFSLNIMLRPIV